MSEKSDDVVTQLDESIFIEKELDCMPDLLEIRKNDKSVLDVYDWRVVFAAKEIIDSTRKLAGIDPIIDRDKPLPKKDSKSKREMKEAVQEVMQEMLEQLFKKQQTVD